MMRGEDDNAVLIAYRHNYVRAQYTWVQAFTEHLTDCARVFQGDLQAMLILAIIGQTLMFQILKESHGDFELGTPLPAFEDAGINASSLSAVLEIPRETVRRKLEWLAKQGWIEKCDSGWRLVMTESRSQAHIDLAELDQRSIQRIAKLFSNFAALAAKAKS